MFRYLCKLCRLTFLSASSSLLSNQSASMTLNKVLQYVVRRLCNVLVGSTAIQVEEILHPIPAPTCPTICATGNWPIVRASLLYALFFRMNLFCSEESFVWLVLPSFIVVR